MNIIRNSNQKSDRRRKGKMSSAGFTPYKERRLLMGKIRSSAGFTLMEVLISILIFAISLMGGIAVYFNASKIKTMATHKEVATEILTATLENLRRNGYEQFGTDHGVADPTVKPLEFHPSSPAMGGIATSQTVTYDDPPTGAPTDFREVAVTLSWQEAFQSGTREVSATSYVAP